MSDNDHAQLEAPPTPMEALARAHEKEAFSLLVEIVRDPAVKPEHRIRAAQDILDRARGKSRATPPPQQQRKRKAVELSEETLLKMLEHIGKRQNAVAAVKPEPHRREPIVFEGEVLGRTPNAPAARKVPRNEYAQQNDIDDVLS